MERAVRGALQRIGSRGAAQEAQKNACPVCGEPVLSTQAIVRAWQGTYAHRDCAHYPGRKRSRRSLRIHKRFTRT
jgi:hypothetical protein